MSEQAAADPGRIPCPYRILDDAGNGFAIGAIGGSIYHFASGYRNTPMGYRLNGAMTAMMTRAPVTGGAFGVWTFMFATGECTFKHLRGKEDPINAVLSGGFTGAALEMRKGPRAAFRAGAIGAVMLGMIEGLIIMMQRMGEDGFRNAPIQVPEMPDSQLPPKPAAA